LVSPPGGFVAVSVISAAGAGWLPEGGVSIFVAPVWPPAAGLGIDSMKVGGNDWLEALAGGIAGWPGGFEAGSGWGINRRSSSTQAMLTRATTRYRRMFIQPKIPAFAVRSQSLQKRSRPQTQKGAAECH
jgi:hypothetical protein